MKSDRQTKLIAVIAMIIAIGGLSIAFAALNQNLSIDGVAAVNQIGFEVRFENLVENPVIGDATIITSPTISANTTHIGTFDVEFNAPGASVSYEATLNNTGTIDAIVDSINIPTPTCTGTGDNATIDAANVCEYIEYTLKYDNGDDINIGDTLASSTTRNVILTLTYNNLVTVDKLPKDIVEISNLAVTIGYVQG